MFILFQGAGKQQSSASNYLAAKLVLMGQKET
jgi:hypothetical protein